MPRPEWVQVGRIVKAHGMRGEVRVAVESDNPDRFAPGSRLSGRPRPTVEAQASPGRQDRRTLVVLGVRGEGGDPIVSFEGIEDRTAAEELRGVILEVPGTELPEPGIDEFYPFDLEGLEVRAPDGRRVGTVKALLENPANDILVVAPDIEPSREMLLPFVREAVPEVELEAGYLVVAESFLRPADEA